MFPVSLLNLASIAPILPDLRLRELVAVRQHEFDFRIVLILIQCRPCIRGSGPRVR